MSETETVRFLGLDNLKLKEDYTKKWSMSIQSLWYLMFSISLI